MRPRDLLFLIGSFVLAFGVGLVWMQQESQALERPPGGWPSGAPGGAPGDVPDDTATGGTPTGPADDGGSAALATATTGDHPPLEVAGVEDPARRRDTAGWTKGVVRGDIQLAVSVLDRLRTISVIVEEARSPSAGTARPYRLVVPVKRSVGTPTFEVTDIPFSEYPYVVTVHAEGLNGSRRTVTIDRDHPLVDDVVLAITPGSPFSILVRDQDAVPYAQLEIFMQPVGEPGGRSRHKATTDNFGSVVFEDVLAGDYQLTVSQGGQNLTSPETLSVQPGLRSYGRKVQGQGHQITLPRGIPVQFYVHDSAGYGVADAQITAVATDRVKLTSVAAATDHGGRAAFLHLQPGVWHLTIEKDAFARFDRQVTLKAGQEPLYLDLQMTRSRR